MGYNGLIFHRADLEREPQEALDPQGMLDQQEALDPQGMLATLDRLGLQDQLVRQEVQLGQLEILDLLDHRHYYQKEVWAHLTPQILQICQLRVVSMD